MDSVPGMIILVGAVAAMGALPWATHRLAFGQVCGGESESCGPRRLLLAVHTNGCLNNLGQRGRESESHRGRKGGKELTVLNCGMCGFLNNTQNRRTGRDYWDLKMDRRDYLIYCDKYNKKAGRWGGYLPYFGMRKMMKD